MIKDILAFDFGLQSLDDHSLKSFRNLQHQQNWITCSLAHYQQILVISLKYIQLFRLFWLQFDSFLGGSNMWMQLRYSAHDLTSLYCVLTLGKSLITSEVVCVAHTNTAS